MDLSIPFAAFGLGAGWAALDRAIRYSTTRVQAGAPLSEKQGYTHKLIVPHAVALEASRAAIEATAERIDAGEPMPQYLVDHCVYYAGPAKTPAGYASGSFGPTNSNVPTSSASPITIPGRPSQLATAVVVRIEADATSVHSPVKR